MLVGIKESKNNQSVAESIETLPECEELVNRFKYICRDLIEPIIPHLEFKGIQTDDNGGGVMMIRVGKSRNAPHRVKTKNNCTIRRQDRCEVLSMREIQDLTLNTARGLERIENKLNERKRRFEEEFERLQTPEQAIGLRITGIPLDPSSSVDKVYENGEIIKEFSRPKVSSISFPSNTNTKRYFTVLLDYLHDSRTEPMLQGARIETDPQLLSGRMFNYGEIYCDGLVELGFLANGDEFQEFEFESDYAVGLMAYLLAWIEKMKRDTGTIVSEYAIQVEFKVRDTLILLDSRSHPVQDYSIDTSLKSRVFPKYSYCGRDDVDNLLKRFERDLLNSVGIDVRSQSEKYHIHVD